MTKAISSWQKDSLGLWQTILIVDLSYFPKCTEFLLVYNLEIKNLF